MIDRGHRSQSDRLRLGVPDHVLGAELQRATDEHQRTGSPEAGGVVAALEWLVSATPLTPMSGGKFEPATAELVADELADAQQAAAEMRDEEDGRWYATGIAAALSWATGRTAQPPAERVAAEFAAIRPAPGVPAWVTPAATDVYRAREVARRGAANTLNMSASDAGTLAALDWVCGYSVTGGPITGTRQPATARITAQLEMMAAFEVLGHPMSGEQMEELGVCERQLRRVPLSFAFGVSDSIAWLTGLHGNPPVDLGGPPAPSSADCQQDR